MTEQQRKDIEEDIRGNVGFLVDGKPVTLPDETISIIMSIIEIRLGMVEGMDQEK